MTKWVSCRHRNEQRARDIAEGQLKMPCESVRGSERPLSCLGGCCVVGHDVASRISGTVATKPIVAGHDMLDPLAHCPLGAGRRVCQLTVIRVCENPRKSLLRTVMSASGSTRSPVGDLAFADGDPPS
jgi:hypothetical protein